MICAEIETDKTFKKYSFIELFRKNLVAFLSFSRMILFRTIIPIVPPYDNTNPTSQIEIGFIINIINAETDKLEIVSGFFNNKSDKIKIMVIIPLRKMLGVLPTSTVKNIIVIIDTIFETFLPNNLLKI